MAGDSLESCTLQLAVLLRGKPATTVHFYGKALSAACALSGYRENGGGLRCTETRIPLYAQGRTNVTPAFIGHYIN